MLFGHFLSKLGDFWFQKFPKIFLRKADLGNLGQKWSKFPKSALRRKI